MASLERIAENVSFPPWVAMRAADCLLSRAEPTHPALTRWLRDPQYKGLGTLTLQRLPQWAPSAQRELALVALQSELRPEALRILPQHPSTRELVETP